MKLNIQDKTLNIEFSTLEQVLAVHGNFSIPIGNINNATTEMPVSEASDIRAQGTYVPRLIEAGSYYSGRGKEFWYTKKGENFLTIELAYGPYERIVLGLDDNKYWEERINSVLQE